MNGEAGSFLTANRNIWINFEIILRRSDSLSDYVQFKNIGLFITGGQAARPTYRGTIMGLNPF